MGIKHITDRLKQLLVKENVTDLPDFKRNEGLQEKTVFGFVNIVVEQAHILERGCVFSNTKPERPPHQGTRGTYTGDRTKSNKKFRLNESNSDGRGSHRKRQNAATKTSKRRKFQYANFRNASRHANDITSKNLQKRSSCRKIMFKEA